MVQGVSKWREDDERRHKKRKSLQVKERLSFLYKILERKNYLRQEEKRVRR
jgi:hypothetical protein